MKRPLIIWFICTILFVLCYLLGCRTGGKTLGSGSAGTVITGKTGAQLNREAEQFRQAQPAKSAPIKSAPIKSEPEVEAESVTPKLLPPPPIRHTPIKPLEPTLRPVKPTLLPLPPAPLISPKSLKLEEKVNVKPIGKQSEKNEEKVENSGGGGIIEKEKTIVNFDWLGLVMFYILGFLTLLVGWFLYKEWKKSDSGLCLCGRIWACLSRWSLGFKMLFADWWQGIKKWWNDEPVKVAPKKVTKKKVGKTTKGKLANKGQRKSRLAANKRPSKKKKS